VIAPPAPEAGIELPEGLEATTFATATDAVPLAEGAIRKVTAASCPLPIAVVFNPKRTHVAESPLVAQVTLFPAEVEEEPASTVTRDNTEG
jgi:hypothetical protein